MVHSYQRLQQKWRFQPLGGSLVYVCVYQWNNYTCVIHILHIQFLSGGHPVLYHIFGNFCSCSLSIPGSSWRGYSPQKVTGLVKSSLLVSQSKLSTYTHTIQRHCVKILEFQQIDPWKSMPMTKHVAGTSGTFWPIFSRKSPFGTKRHSPLRRHRYPKWRNVHPSCDHHPSRRRRLIRKSMVEARGRADHLRIDHQR